MNPKLCLNTSTIKPQPLMEKIRLAGEVGYDGIELWINDLYEHIGQGGEISDVEKALDDHGLIVPCCIAIRQWGDMHGWEYKLVMDEAKRRFDLGARIGAPYIVATPPIEACDISTLPERYADLLHIGRETGIKPTFEYISFFKSIHQLSQAWDVVQQSGDSDATLILDAFFSPNWGLGEFRGHIERTFHREEIFGFGANYMFFGEQDSFLDQLIVRFEATFTPDRVFTDPSLLGADFLVEDEYITSLVVEKYHRFTQNFPATYMVFQWLHKSESDIFGRHLDGYGASPFGPPTGRSSFNALSFAFQQPSPTLKWRADFALLWDPEGGYLIQPGLRYKPSKSISAELFANFVGGGDDNMDAMSTFDYVEEIAFRLTYQF